jgi:ribose transport system permease protein
MELFAIAGAVLGGCSLRGGEGTTAGMVIGAAILTLLSHLINTLEIKDTLEPVVIGLALLFCAILDEQLRRGYSWRDALAAAKRLVRRA